jgi:hypothetical protein
MLVDTFEIIPEPMDIWETTKKMEVYNEQQIQSAWQDYITDKIVEIKRTDKIVEIKRNGKKEYKEFKPGWMDRVDGTRAKVVQICKVMSFPKYLKKVFNGG